MQGSGSILSKGLRSDIRLQSQRYFSRTYGMLKDIHFGWFVLFPVFSTSISLGLGAVGFFGDWAIVGLVLLGFFAFLKLSPAELKLLVRRYADVVTLHRLALREPGSLLRIEPFPERPRRQALATDAAPEIPAFLCRGDQSQPRARTKDGLEQRDRQPAATADRARRL